MINTSHVPVMAAEAMEALNVFPGGRYVDATLGGAAHTEQLLKRSAPGGKVLSLDVDCDALRRASAKLKPYGSRWLGVEENFRRLEQSVVKHGLAPVDGVLMDLGLSSDQLADPAKGLSFQLHGPLDMRLGPKANDDGLTAADIVNSWKERELAELIREYGEERYARRIAAEIVKARKRSRFVHTTDLVSVISQAVPANYERGRLHPATRTFQALRLAVNDEPASLKQAIEGARRALVPGGRLVIISFHSLEDRIVKNAFRQAHDLKPIFKKPLIPKLEEIHANPRSRSAKLRAAIKTNHKILPIPKQNYVASLCHVISQTA